MTLNEIPFWQITKMWRRIKRGWSISWPFVRYCRTTYVMIFCQILPSYWVSLAEYVIALIRIARELQIYYISTTICPIQVCVNSFNIVNGEMQAIGTGIYLAPSILDHSCAPNAVVTFDGFHLSVQLTEDCPSFNWNDVRISYIELMNCNQDRMKELKERYYFDCDCPRCHSDAIDRYRYAAKCPKCLNAITIKVIFINSIMCARFYCWTNHFICATIIRQERRFFRRARVDIN